jgi:hypothetical protein
MLARFRGPAHPAHVALVGPPELVVRVKRYIIEPERGFWVLRRSGHNKKIVSGATAESAKEQALERLRPSAPCRMRVMAGVREEWELGHRDGQWAQVEIRRKAGA